MDLAACGDPGPPLILEASVDGETSARSVQLWSASVLQKVGLLVFSFSVGRAGGAEAVGVMAAVLALSWILNTLVMMGQPDRMVFAAAGLARLLL